MLLACGKKAKQVLDKEQMASVLTDLYLTESKIDRLPLKRDSAQKLMKQLRPLIYKKHRIDSAAFRRSFEYYFENLDKLKKVYELTLDSLTYRETALEKAKNDKLKAEKALRAKEDSIRQMKIRIDSLASDSLLKTPTVLQDSLEKKTKSKEKKEMRK